MTDRAALVEKVGKLLWYDGSGFDIPNHLLTAAIDLIRAEVAMWKEAARPVPDLRAEVERLTAVKTQYQNLYDREAAENATLRADKERMRAALYECLETTATHHAEILRVYTLAAPIWQHVKLRQS